MCIYQEKKASPTFARSSSLL